MTAANKGKCPGRCGASSRHTTKLKQSIFFKYLWFKPISELENVAHVSLIKAQITLSQMATFFEKMFRKLHEIFKIINDEKYLRGQLTLVTLRMDTNTDFKRKYGLLKVCYRPVTSITI
jgi:hypothetical protein